MTAPAPQVVSILRTLIEERTGLSYADQDALLVDKLTTRAADAGFDSLLDYYYHLRYDADSQAQFKELLESLVVNETYFFRERETLRVAIEEAVAPLLAQGKRPRLWSAACSTGEEPYSMAMLLAAQDRLDQVEILGTDISERVLTLARTGNFRPRSVRTEALPPEAERWLSRSSGRPVLDPHILNAVQFAQVNLTDNQALRALGTFDLIVCRNVLIYFADTTVQRLLDELSERLRPGGVLLVGVCESLLRFSTSLVCEERQGVFLYRKGSA